MCRSMEVRWVFSTHLVKREKTNERERERNDIRLFVSLSVCFFRVRKLPSLVETIIVMTIQIDAHDKGNDFLACRSFSLFLVFSLALFSPSSFFSAIQISFTPILVFVSMEKQWPSSCSLSPSLPCARSFSPWL